MTKLPWPVASQALAEMLRQDGELDAILSGMVWRQSSFQVGAGSGIR